MYQNRPGSEEIQAALKAGWIQVQEINLPFLVRLLQQTLDRGEAEAIALALELQADWMLLDEHRSCCSLNLDARLASNTFGQAVPVHG